MQKKVTQQRRPGGDWGDSDNEEEEKQQSTVPQIYSKEEPSLAAYNINQFKQPIIYLPQQQGTSKYQDSLKSKLSLLSLEELSNQNCEYEKKIVEDQIQPVGVRIKTSKSVLEQFLKSCGTLDEQKIGSLLLHYLNMDCNPQMKAKCLYAIEFLAKNNEKYMEFFKENVQMIENCEINNQTIKDAQVLALGTVKNQNITNQQQKKVDNILSNIHEIPSTVQKQPVIQDQAINKKVNLLEDEDEQPNKIKQNAFTFIKKTETQQEPSKKQTAFNFIKSDKAVQPQQQKASNNLLDDFDNDGVQQKTQKINAFEFIKSDKQNQQQQVQQKQNAYNFIPKSDNQNQAKGNNLLDLNFDIFDSSPVTQSQPQGQQQQQQQQPQITSNNLMNMYQQPVIQPQSYEFQYQMNQQQQQQQPQQIQYQNQNQFNQQMNQQFQPQNYIPSSLSSNSQQFSLNKEQKQNSQKKAQIETAFDFINL